MALKSTQLRRPEFVFNKELRTAAKEEPVDIQIKKQKRVLGSSGTEKERKTERHLEENSWRDKGSRKDLENSANRVSWRCFTKVLRLTENKSSKWVGCDKNCSACCEARQQDKGPSTNYNICITSSVGGGHKQILLNVA